MSKTITTIEQLDTLIEQAAAAAQTTRRERSPDVGRLERRRDALVETRRRYRQRHDQLAQQATALESDLSHAEERLRQVQEQVRVAVERAQGHRDTLFRKLSEAQEALAALVLIIPPEETYPPPDSQTVEFGQTRYYRRGVQVQRDGSPLSNG